MKIIAGALLLAAVAVPGMAQAQVPQYQRGYTQHNGTYVQPHYRTVPDGTRNNNYSTQGNINPYTGQRGHVNPYAPRRY